MSDTKEAATNQDSFWGGEGKEMEWTEFESNSLFVVKSAEEDQKSGSRLLSDAEQEIRETKSAGRLRLLRQRSLEQRKHIDTKIPISSIRPKHNNDQFVPVDDTNGPTLSGVSAEVDEERGEVPVASGDGDEKRGVVASPVPPEDPAKPLASVPSDEQHPTVIEVDEESGKDISVTESDFTLEPLADTGARSSAKGTAAVGATDSNTSVPEMAPTKSDELSVYSKGVLSELPPELLEHMSSLEEAENRNLSTTHVEESEQRRRSRRRCCLITFAIFVLTISIIAIVMGVILGKKESSPSADGGSFVSPPVGSPPVGAPTNNGATTEQQMLQDLITSASLDSGTALSDPRSPQSKALVWLENNANVESYPDWRKIQRHTLATFYYSTNGEEWIESDGWLTNEHECNWYTSDTGPNCDENGAFVRLALSNNNLTGTLPRDLAILSDSLLAVEFQDLPMSGSIPTEFGHLKKLEYLYLKNNALTGKIPTELGQLEKLLHLGLQDNELSSTIPSELGNLVSLDRLWIQDNKMSGTLPVELTNASNLAGLFLSHNNFRGSLPSEIGRWTNLRHLHIDNNELTGMVPTEIGSTRLVEAAMSENNFSGSIPSEIGTLGALQLLSISSSSSSLKGELPSQIGLLSSLRFFTLYSADIEGPIPTEIGLLSSLGVLIFGRTNLSGPIPTEFGNLTRLARLFLSQNDLKGTIPTEIGALTNLLQLHLEQQELFGRIPTEISLLTRLDSFVIFGNDITGPFKCPEFIESCAISCNNGTEEECRALK